MVMIFKEESYQTVQTSDDPYPVPHRKSLQLMKMKTESMTRISLKLKYVGIIISTRRMKDHRREIQNESMLRSAKRIVEKLKERERNRKRNSKETRNYMNDEDCKEIHNGDERFAPISKSKYKQDEKCEIDAVIAINSY